VHSDAGATQGTHVGRLKTAESQENHVKPPKTGNPKTSIWYDNP